MGTAATKAKNKYNKSNYDRVNLIVTPEFKGRIKFEADRCGESVNSFINRALSDKICGKTSSEDTEFECFRFSVFYNEEIVADVEVDKKEAKVRRYTLHPAKQLFYADRIPRYILGEILSLRCWDKEREDLQECLSSIGLTSYDPYKICRKTHGITYADRIWFRYDGEFFDGIKALEELYDV